MIKNAILIAKRSKNAILIAKGSAQLLYISYSHDISVSWHVRAVERPQLIAENKSTGIEES